MRVFQTANLRYVIGVLVIANFKLSSLMMMLLLPDPAVAWVPTISVISEARQEQRQHSQTSLLLLSVHADKSQPPVEVVQKVEIVNAANGDDGPNDIQLRFGGVGRLYSNKSKNGSKDEETDLILDRLQRAVVVVIGLGGVGSWAAEALCRSGIGTLVLIDLDDICISNTNRQLHVLSSTIGQMKIDTMRERILRINPSCTVQLVHDFVTPENVHDILVTIEQQHCSGITAIVEAIDGAKEKAAILAHCDKQQIPVITCGGAAGRIDPVRIQKMDITQVNGDKLLAACKKYLRKDYGFHAGLPFRQIQKGKKVKKWNIDCVCSDEEVTTVTRAEHSIATTSSSFRQCDGALGTACFVTGTFGFVAAAAIVDGIANDTLRIPRGR